MPFVINMTDILYTAIISGNLAGDDCLERIVPACQYMLQVPISI